MLVTCAIIIQNHKVLITQRPLHKSQGGKWEFPGGKVQNGETPEECIVREIMEELDLSIKVEHRLETVNHSYPDLTIELLPLVCRISDGSLTLHEHMAFLWVPIAQLTDTDLCEADRKIISQLSTIA